MGKPLEQLFDAFEERPIASASIAQVHVARLNGQKVAVKVQHPLLADQFWADMLAQWACLTVAPWFFKGFEFAWMHGEVEGYLRQELDFVNEGRNAERTARNFVDNLRIRVPTIHWNRSAKRVLTMEFMEAVPMAEFVASQYGLSSSAVGGAVIECFAQQIFRHGFVHCDPHPSNLFVELLDANGATILPRDANRLNTADFKVVLLDHGLYRALEDKTRLQYANLWRHLILRDNVQVQRVCNEMGVGEHWITFSSMVLMRPYLPLTSSLIPMSHGEAFSPEQLKEFWKYFSVEIITETMRNMPRELLLVLRNQNYIRGLNQQLGMPVNRFRLMARTALGAVGEETWWLKRWTRRLVFEVYLLVQDWVWFLGVRFFSWRVSRQVGDTERALMSAMQ